MPWKHRPVALAAVLLLVLAVALAAAGCTGSETEAGQGMTASEETTISTAEFPDGSTSDSIEIDSSTADSTAAAAQGPAGEAGNAQLVISGGYTSIDAGGDGLDINGTVQMTGGTVLINGPTNDGNGAIDYYGEFKVTGGLLMAVGSSGMAEAPSENSAQYSIMVNLEQAQQAETLVHVQDQNGDDLLTFLPAKQYQSVLISSPDIQSGSTYTLFLGGSSNGTETDSLYSEGAYTPGTEYVSLEVSGIITISGAGGPGGPGGGAVSGGGQGAFPGGGTR